MQLPTIQPLSSMKGITSLSKPPIEDVLQKLTAKAVALQKADPNAKLLIDEHEASIVTGFKVASLRKRRWAGEAPRFYKIGSKVKYNYFDLQTFLEGCLCNATGRE